jgi:glycogen debranching enzyme
MPPVAPPSSVTLVQGRSFAISDRGGDIERVGPSGVFVGDTRICTQLLLTVDGMRVQPLAWSSDVPFHARFVGRIGVDGYDQAPVLVVRNHWVGRGLRADVTLRHSSAQERPITVALFVASDLAGLFAVKEGRAGGPNLPPQISGDALMMVAGRQGVSLRPTPDAQLSVIDDGVGVITWDVVLAPRGSWTGCVELAALVDGHELPTRYRSGEPVDTAVPVTRQAEWLAKLPTVESDVPELSRSVRQAGDDLGALRIFDPDRSGDPVLAAGAPWFMTLFGRDSILSSWMALVLGPELGLSTARVLARLQGTRHVPSTEEEPGRILHEVRANPSGTLSIEAGTIYYGSVDATPLFVMLVGELYRWGVPLAELTPLLPAVDAALAWIDTIGDRDGDGYVEYRRSSSSGLVNQGWKDSGDGISFADGRLPSAPIALVEVQAYAYAAWLAGALLARAEGRLDEATRRQKRAEALRTQFNRDFWLPERGALALALDGDKRAVDAVASNMGHCLWTGIVEPAFVPDIARWLLSPELASGWGVRTLATSMARYDPITYHNGSVWPHDTAICVAGLRRAGHVDDANRLAMQLLAAASAVGGRLPELFAGLTPEDLSRPVPYPTSCSPQAWASAAPLLLLRSILGFEPDVPAGRVVLDPVLPYGTSFLRVHEMSFAGQAITIEVERRALAVHGLPRGLAVVRPA